MCEVEEWKKIKRWAMIIKKKKAMGIEKTSCR